MAWNDFELTTVGVPTAGPVRALIADLKVYDAVTGLPARLIQDGQEVNTITTTPTGRANFQAEDVLVARVEALGWSMLVESNQQKIAKGTFTGDLDSATDRAIDRAEAEGRLVTGEFVAAGYVAKGALVVNAKDHPSAQAAVDAGEGGTVHWPRGTYDVPGNITNLWGAEHTGTGVLRYPDGSTFAVTPRATQTNTIYANGTSGDDANDGLSLASAVRSLARVESILRQAAKGEGLRAAWVVKLAGTFQAGRTFRYLPAFTQPLTFEGEALDANGQPVTTINYGPGSEQFGLRFDPSGAKVTVLRLKFTGFAVDFNGYGVLMKAGGELMVRNCVAENCDIGFAAIRNVSFYMSDSTARNCRTAFSTQYSSSGTWTSCVAKDSEYGFYTSRNAVTHVDYCTAENNSYAGVQVDHNARVHVLGSDLRRNNHGVRAEGGGEWVNGDGNTFNFTGANANTVPWAHYGNARETRQYSQIARNEFVIGQWYGNYQHTGTTAETILASGPELGRLIPDQYRGGNKKLRFRIRGYVSGTGSKTIRLSTTDPASANNTTLLSFTTSAGAAGDTRPFMAEVEVRPGLNDNEQRTYGHMVIHGEPPVVIAQTVVGFNPALERRFRVAGTLGSTSGIIQMQWFEAYSVG